ncbi:translation initiation factor eIF-2B subunit delta [Fusarium subglutinans]|uniref:Translation initiation factor eIF-2B subunit delta n=1 Tax=Gibberella subglutinans TaxID=42677 RepID=A0A8H5L6J5_GIBSU|nr:translation initiation factor eIF-2B subunit delta [Fusarium subglutinans]KAF5585619.1 translation initiation factor eIF-2B subunit delta [Fusarium subglutinans]
MATVVNVEQVAVEKAEDQYANFIASLAEKAKTSRIFLRYKVLDTFLHLDSYPGPNGIPFHVRDAKLSLISFDKSGNLTLTPDIKEHEIALKVDMDSSRQIFIVENITPKVIRIFGGLWNVDPQFFLDYIDAVPSEMDITKEVTPPRPDLIPTAWYRHQAVEGCLPILKSMSTRYDHVSFRFVGPREYKREDSCKVLERMKPDMKELNVERIAGLHVPITRKLGRGGRQFDNVAMTRHCSSIWFKQPDDSTHSEWTKAVILIDPPFEPEDGENMYGTRADSAYRSFICRPLPNEGSDFHPLVVTQAVARIIASEWISTSAYIERDLNTLEWRLENDEPGMIILESFLKKLFILRRQIRKYQGLVDEQSQLFRKYLPHAWITTYSPTTEKARAYMEGDFEQVRSTILDNAARLSDTLGLVTSMIQIRKGEQSAKQNDRLSFLTVIATVVLPSNALAAILGSGCITWGKYMQSRNEG